MNTKQREAFIKEFAVAKHELGDAQVAAQNVKGMVHHSRGALVPSHREKALEELEAAHQLLVEATYHLTEARYQVLGGSQRDPGAEE